MRAALWLAGGALGLGALVGCGPNCQSTCDQIYSVCGITKPGQAEEGLLRTCNQTCDAALREAGELGSYNPNARRASAASITLENEAQAAAWMDCVWTRVPDGTPEQCAALDPTSGYCAPI